MRSQKKKPGPKPIHIATINGVTDSVVNWSAKLGIQYNTVRMRIKSGMTPEAALLTPVDTSKANRKRPVVVSEAKEADICISSSDLLQHELEAQHARMAKQRRMMALSRV